MKYWIFISLFILSISAGTTFSSLQQQMAQLTSPFVSLMFIYDSSTEIGPSLQAAIQDFKKRKEGYLKVIAIDCNTDDPDMLKHFPYCSGQIKSQLPALLFTQPNLNTVEPADGEKSQPKTHPYQGSLQQKALYDFAIPLMKLYSINLKKSSDWNKLKQSYPKTPKIIYFTDKQKISPFFKTLTAHFRNTIAFGHVFKNSSLCQELGITHFPSLLLNGQTQIEMSTDLLKQVEILEQYQGPKTQIIIQQIKVQTSVLDEDNVQQLIYQNPRHILVHIPGADGKQHPQWKNSQGNFKKMFDYFQTETLATKFGVKNRPAIIYFPKSLAKKDLKKAIFHPSDSFRIIYDEISGLIQDFTIPVSSDKQMQQMTSISLKQGRFISVLFHKDDISLSYRVLSNDDRFKQHYTFLRMKNPEDQVLKKFSIKKIPSLFVMELDDQPAETQTKSKQKQNQEEGKTAFNLKIASYTGKFNYDDLEKYLKYFLKTPAQEQIQSTHSVIELTSRKKFQSACIGQGCYLLLVDNSPSKTNLTAQYKSILQKAASKLYQNQNVGYLDARCHSQILEKLQIYADDLPVFIYLNSKFQKYNRLVGRIEQKSLETFFTKVKANKGIWRSYSSLVFQNKDCSKQHQRLRKLEQTGSQMSAQQAEILQEIKRQQENKKASAATNDGQSKKRRKRRRPKQQESQL